VIDTGGKNTHLEPGTSFRTLTYPLRVLWICKSSSLFQVIPNLVVISNFALKNILSWEEKLLWRRICVAYLA
jgi:hypothetical protein